VGVKHGLSYKNCHRDETMRQVPASRSGGAEAACRQGGGFRRNDKEMRLKPDDTA
jgi:hypothetical protein